MNTIVFVAALCAGTACAMEERANPIRKVVAMLQNMQTKIGAEAKEESAAYDKYMCWCKTGGGDLGKSIGDANIKVPELQSSIEEAEAQAAQLKEDLAAHNEDRAADKKAMAEATALRKTENDAFNTNKAELDSNIGAISRAVAALEKGMAGGFIQTSAAQILRKFLSSQESLSSDRQTLLAFLSNTQGSEYTPQSGQITGILKTMHDEMSADLADATAAEAAALQGYDSLMAAKTKGVNALTKMIEEKLERQAATSVSIAEMKNELTDTETALIEDTKFLANIESSCANKKKEWAVRSATRAEELVALAETIKVLNDDDALELFKKVLPSASASFVQVQAGKSALRAQALAMVEAAKSPNLGFIALALQGKKIGFAKVIQMIDEMVAQLKVEQTDDDNKKTYCANQFDESDDKKKSLERSVSDLETAIADTEESIASLKESIAATKAGIAALDTSVAEATAQRKQQNVDFTQMMAQDSAAIEVLNFAINRLNKFYNPKLYKAPAKVELSEADRIVVNEGGTLAPAAAAGGIAGTGITVLADVSSHDQSKVAPPPPPETFGAYAKKDGETGGVIQMIKLLIADLDQEMSEGKTEEADAQADYEKLMTDSGDKRASDSKKLSDETAAKADAEAALQQHGADKKSTEAELGATNQYIASLHGECDWLIKYFEVRKEARAGEVDALGNARAVLNGADFSL